MNQAKQFLNALSGRVQSRSIGDKMTFDGLNEDCIIFILEKLDFEDLLSMAQVNENLRVLANDVFRRKFAKKKIVIYNYFLDEEPEEELGIIAKALTRLRFKFIEKRNANPATIINNESIEIMENVYNSLNVLKCFGNRIQKLKLVFGEAESDESQKILRFVNKYCSESLIDFELDVSEGNAFKCFKKPFKTIEHLSLRDFIPNIEESIPQMNHTFPVLHSLSLTPLRLMGNYIKCYFSHLEHLCLDVPYCTTIDDLLQINPHVKSVELAQATPQFMQNVNTKLPNLENLAIWDIELSQEMIQFENVKKFIAKNTLNSPRNIHFPKLQELQINFGDYCVEEWINFLKSHNNLSYLQLKYWKMDDKQFERLTKELPNLVEVSVVRFNGQFIGIYSILKFVEKHEKLMKLNLDACERNDYEVIREKFEFKWEIRNFRKGLSLEHT